MADNLSTIPDNNPSPKAEATDDSSSNSSLHTIVDNTHNTVTNVTNTAKFSKLIADLSPESDGNMTQDLKQTLELHHKKLKIFEQQKNVVFRGKAEQYLPSSNAPIQTSNNEQTLLKFIRHQTHMLDVMTSFADIPKEIAIRIRNHHMFQTALKCLEQLETSNNKLQTIPATFTNSKDQDILEADYTIIRASMGGFMETLNSRILEFKKTMEYISSVNQQKPTRTTENILKNNADIPNSYFEDLQKLQKRTQEEVPQTLQHPEDDKLETSDLHTEINLMLSHIFGSHSKQFQSNDEMLLAFKHFFNINDDLSENELLTQVQSCYHDCMIDNDLRDNLISFVSEHLNESMYATANSELYTTAFGDEPADTEVDQLSKLTETSLMMSDHDSQRDVENIKHLVTGTRHKTPINHPTGSQMQQVQKVHFTPADTHHTDMLQFPQAKPLPALSRSNALKSDNLRSALNLTPSGRSRNPRTPSRPPHSTIVPRTLTPVSLHSQAPPAQYAQPTPSNISASVPSQPIHNPILQPTPSNTGTSVPSQPMHDFIHQPTATQPAPQSAFLQPNVNYPQQIYPQGYAYAGNTARVSNVPSTIGPSYHPQDPYQDGQHSYPQRQFTLAPCPAPQSGPSGPQYHTPFSGNQPTYPSQGIGQQYDPSRQSFLRHTFGSPYSSVQPLSDFDTRVQTVVNECRQLRNCIQTVSTGLDRLIDDSSDTEYKKRDIEATLREFADKATDLFNKSIQCYNILQSLEHLPTHQDSARFIDETHREAEALYSRVGTASPRIHHNLKTRESAKSAIDIDDIKSQMTFPTFDGTDTISSKNIFEYFSEAEAFFEQRSTKEAIKANFIKSNLRDPALSSSKEVLANHKDYRQIKRILINKYGRLTAMYQSLNKHHEEVGVIPSLHGNNVPWATIRKKAKKHWRLIQKGSAIEKHFADRGETFQNSYAYIGSVVNFLPTEMMTMDEVADAKDFSIIKEKFRIVLNKSETQERLCMSNAQS